MALTRAQLLAGNQSQGFTLPGQVQGVSQGTGVIIAANGQISVDASTVTGLMKLNNAAAYNAYVWPGADGAAGEFLKTDGAGNLDWVTPQGFAVVTVQPQPAPSPTDIGELWFDCTTGTLNVWQGCVGTPSPNWFNVAQPGLPVLPANTSAAPMFTGGTGTQADPYDCTVTTTGVGTSVFVVNTVTITGLAPFQYVPIVDLNAVTNGGRFSFSNNYANATGSLTFQTIFKDQPPSLPGTSFTANIKVGYGTVYIDAIVNVVTPLSLSAGVITGTPTVGTAVAYTPGVASGGTAPYTYTYQWFADGVAIGSATASAFIPTSAEVGKTLSVTQTVTDASLSTATNTATASSATSYAPFPGAVWTPTPANGMSTNPGGESGTYSGTATSITTTGCVEASVNGGPYSVGTQAIATGQTLAIRWVTSAPCGQAATGTPISGTLTDGVYQNNYNLTINRIPSPPIADISDTNIALGAVTTKAIASPIAGLNSTAYVTYVGTSTGTVISASTDNVTFTPLATSGTGFPVTNGQTLYIRQTVGGTISTGYTAIIQVGDGTGTAGTYDEFTYTATTVATAGFPNLPASLVTGPAQIPQVVSGTWADGPQTNLTSTGCLQISLDGTTWGQGPLTIANGATLYEQWNPTGATCGDAASGTTITGTLTNGTYTNSYSLTLDRNPAAFTLNAITGQALSSTATSNVVTLSGTNAPAYITYTAGSPNTLTNVKVAINSGAYVTVPTSGTTLSAPPGATLQFQGGVGGTNSTAYTITVNAGTTTAAWSVTTTAVTPSIQTPTVTNPTNGQTGLSGYSLQVTGDTYTPLNGAGATQTSSTWEVYRADPINPETSAIISVGSATISSEIYLWDPASLGSTPANLSDLRARGTLASNPCNPNSPGPVKDVYWVPQGSQAAKVASITAFSSDGGIGFNFLATTGGTFFNEDGSARPSTAYSYTSSEWTSLNWVATNGTTSPAAYLLDADAAYIRFSTTLKGGGLTGTFKSYTTSAPELTFTDNTNLSNMQVGDSITEVGGGADASGTIWSIDVANKKVVVSPSTGTWSVGATAKDTSRTVTAPAPTTEPPNATDYTAIAGSPFTVSASPFTSLTIPSASLQGSTTYYARVQYATTVATAATSSYSAWSKFTTAATPWPLSTPAGAISPPSPVSMAYDGSRYWVLGLAACPIITSTDGYTWTAPTDLSGLNGGTAWSTTSSTDGVFKRTSYSDTAKQFAKTSDGGTNWTYSTQAQIGTTGSGYKMYLHQYGTSLLYSAPEGVYRSTNGGGTWGLIPSSPIIIGGGAQGGMFASKPGGRIYELGLANEKLYYSDDGGTTWTYSSVMIGGQAGFGDFVAIKYGGPGNDYFWILGGARGTIYYCLATVPPVNFGGVGVEPANRYWSDIGVSSASNLVMVVGENYMYKTTNFGTSWTPVTLKNNGTWATNVDYLNGLWIVAGNGKMAVSNDDGATWAYNF